MTHATIESKHASNVSKTGVHKGARPWNPREAAFLDLAIDEEKESHLFYKSIFNRVHNPSLKRLFRQLAADELLHKAQLEALRDGTKHHYGHSFGECKLPQGADFDLPQPRSADQRALALALRWERASVRLYLDLAQKTRSEQLHKALIGLALDEIKQKHALILTFMQQAA